MAVAGACTAAARAASLGLLSIPSLSRRTRRKDSLAAGNSRLGSAQVWSSQPTMLRASVDIDSEPWSSTAAWKAGSANAGPSRRRASARILDRLGYTVDHWTGPARQRSRPALPIHQVVIHRWA